MDPIVKATLDKVNQLLGEDLTEENFIRAMRSVDALKAALKVVKPPHRKPRHPKVVLAEELELKSRGRAFSSDEEELLKIAEQEEAKLLESIDLEKNGGIKRRIENSTKH